MAYGKSIELFLVNGTADSLITAELSNWNGKAIKIPRTEVKDCNRDDVKGTGVYFLFCKEDDGSDSVYIGEAENVIDRLNQHLRDFQSDKEKYYWNTAVIFVGRDLDKALIRYLENQFVRMARESKRYTVLTKNTYQNTVLKESKIAAMDEFIDNVRIIINTLGYKVLESIPQATDDTTYFYCRGNNSNAKGFLSSNGFTIVKGSIVSDHTVDSFELRANTYFKLRNQLIKNNVIENGIFTTDYEFNSPSAASAVVLGRSSNGPKEWKTITGVNLKELF